MAYEYNKDFLVQLKPNISKVFTRAKENGGDSIHWKTNNDSFRGPELNNESEHRIIVYGDSNIQARFSDTVNTFTGQLDHYLIKSGLRDFEILNAGVVGFGPDQSLIRFELEAEKYVPDIVIFHIFADNDFGDLIRNRLFHLNDRGSLVATEHKKTIDPYLLEIKRKKHKYNVSNLLIVKGLLKIKREFLGIFVKETAVKRLNNLQELSEAEYSVYNDSKPRKFSHFSDHYDIDVATNTHQESSRIKIKLMSEVIIKAKRLADAKSISLLVLIQPSIIDLTTDNSVLDYKYLQKKFPNYNRENLTSEVENICILNEIKYINLFDVFLENNPNNLFFIANDNHWNDQGQKLAAKQTALYLTNNSMIGN